MTHKNRNTAYLNRGGAPSKGRGRLQLAARRALYGRDLVTTGDVARTAYARHVLLDGKQITPDRYRLVRCVMITPDYGAASDY